LIIHVYKLQVIGSTYFCILRGGYI